MAPAYIDTPGPWQSLFVVATQLLDEAATHAGGPFHWTVGGGTGLMLRHHHRRSKDIDIFVTDPQVLGHLNPRMGGLAEDLVGRYDESATHL